MSDLHNFRRVSEDFGYLVEMDPGQPCCGSCIDEQEAEVTQRYSDYCCCAHGEKYATVYKGEVSWVEDGSHDRYEANRIEQSEEEQE